MRLGPLAATKSHVWVCGPAAVGGICVNVCDLSYHQKPPETMWIFEDYAAAGDMPVLLSEAMGTCRPRLLPGIISGYGVLWQLGSVLMSQAVTTQGHADVPGLDCCLLHFAELAPPLAWAA